MENISEHEVSVKKNLSQEKDDRCEREASKPRLVSKLVRRAGARSIGEEYKYYIENFKDFCEQLSLRNV